MQRGNYPLLDTTQTYEKTREDVFFVLMQATLHSINVLLRMSA
jgi:hypothetical protein